ncbi:MAG: insulinase family protein, partial [Sphingobacteriales bacterium]
FLNLREAHGWTYGAYSGIGGSKYVGTFASSTSVRNAVTDSAVAEILNEVKKIRTDLVSEEDLKNAKAKYVGNFVMQIEKPATVARYALLTRTQNLPADFYENYIKNINAVTPEDVRNAAKKFFSADNARIVIVGKASDVLPGLEKSGIPIQYFDKYGKPAEKPVATKAVPAGVTAKTVLDNYIKAVGGEKAVKAVKSIATKSTGTIQGRPITFTMKVTSDHKQLVDISMDGMGSVMKQVVNEKGGYSSQMGQKEAMEGEDLADAKASAVPFEELGLLTNAEAKLTGIEKVNEAEAYVIRKGKTAYFYDTKTGLKIAESSDEEGPNGEKAVMFRYYSDYKDVKGIKLPHRIVMNIGVELDLTVTEAKINEGVTAADFQ